MDVTLPDGTVVKGIPDGTTKAQLASKLKSNGMNVPDSWMTGTSTQSPEKTEPGSGIMSREQYQHEGNERTIGPYDQYVQQQKSQNSQNTAEKTAEENEGVFGKIHGAANALASSAIQAPINFAAGAADVVHANALRDWLEKQGQTMAPTTATGQRYQQNIGNAINNSGIGGLAPEVGAVGNLAREAPGATGQAGRIASEGAGRIAAPIATGAERIAAPVRNIASDLSGSRIAPAKAEAATSARTAVEQAAGQADIEAARQASKAQGLSALQTRLDQHLDAQRTSDIVPNMYQQGTTIRTAMNAAYDVANKERADIANSEFPAVKESAQAREANGERVDTKGVETDLLEIRKQAKGIPGLEDNLDRMLSSIRGDRSETAASVSEPPVAGRSLREKLREPEGILGKPSAPGAPPPVQRAAIPQGKTFEQLELTRRYLNDIAYSGTLEGYPSIIRNQARDASHKLDAAMQDFVPEFRQYKENYAKNSEPLHSLDTRLGRAVTGTEGGLQESAYAKTSAQDLPSRLFSKKEGIDLVVDALAGGKNATPEARAAAQSTVDKMVENWISENTRTMSGKKASEYLNAPGMSATLSSTPKVAERLISKFESRANLEQRSADLAKSAEEARKTSITHAEASNKMRQDLENADILSNMKDTKSQDQALSGYMTTLARARNSGLITPEKYKATLDLVSRANTLEERTARARRIAKAIVGTGTALVIGKELAAPGT